MSDTSIRYSLTFRHVSARFLRSTLVVGDSNTRHLKFGEGLGTFGQLIPGKRSESIHIKDIDPSKCVGYKNIFIHCGVNDLKAHSRNVTGMVVDCFNTIREKLDEIMTLCSNAKIVVSPILPTKRSDWNNRALHFNRLLFEYSNSLHRRFETLSFGSFVDERTGFLRDDLGLYWNPRDPLHLGHQGVLALVKLIREQVFNNKISYNRKYSDTVQGSTASEGRRSHGASQPHRTSFGAS